jgi:hypothetical protein
MSKPVSEQLFRLVKSLSKSEKRQFKLLSKRTSPEETKKFVSLFDAVDSLMTYDEQALEKKGSANSGVANTQYESAFV